MCDVLVCVCQTGVCIPDWCADVYALDWCVYTRLVCLHCICESFFSVGGVCQLLQCAFGQQGADCVHRCQVAGHRNHCYWRTCLHFMWYVSLVIVDWFDICLSRQFLLTSIMLLLMLNTYNMMY